jgi:hypothetical protein
MAEELFDGVAFAIGVQTEFGTENTTVSDLTDSSTTDLTTGFVLGDAESGDAASGITIPNIAGVYRDVAVVAGSFTESADAFQKAEVNGLSISWVMQGNGSDGNIGAGLAEVDDTMPGVDAILQTVGLEPTDSTTAAPAVSYTCTSTATTIYSTIKLFIADQSFTYSDCLAESLTIEFTPGGFAVATANFAVGTFVTADAGNDLTFPTVDYDVMASITGPVVEGVAFSAFGQTRGFENLTVTITNTVEKFGDSNVDTTGERQSQTKRAVSVSGTLYSTTTSNVEYANLISTTAPTADLSFQVGTAATSTADTINAFAIEVHNLQAKDIKYNRIGTALTVELNDAKATSTTAGEEFYLIFN